jgi:DNA-binding transcriptional LysR family regulator
LRSRGTRQKSGGSAEPCAVLGLARLPLWQIRDLVDQGAVVIVLSEFETEGMPIQLVWPPMRAPLERVRRFVDFLANGLRTDLL